VKQSAHPATLRIFRNTIDGKHTASTPCLFHLVTIHCRTEIDLGEQKQDHITIKAVRTLQSSFALIKVLNWFLTLLIWIFPSLLRPLVSRWGGMGKWAEEISAVSPVYVILVEMVVWYNTVVTRKLFSYLVFFFILLCGKKRWHFDVFSLTFFCGTEFSHLLKAQWLSNLGSLIEAYL